MEQTEFTITEEDKLRAKQKAEAYLRLAELLDYLRDDFTVVRRIFAGKDEGDKLLMLELFEPFRAIGAAKARGDRVVFKKRFIVIDGKRKPRATKKDGAA